MGGKGEKAMLMLSLVDYSELNMTDQEKKDSSLGIKTKEINQNQNNSLDEAQHHQV